MLCRPSMLVLALALVTAGCGIFESEQEELAQAVEPSLKAAAATAEVNHDYQGAARHWRTLYMKHPEDKGLALALARNLRYAGQPQQAADVMQSMLGRKGRDGDLLTELGKDYLAAERLGLAVKSLEEAQALAPTRWEPSNALGVCFDMQGKPDAAAKAYAQALIVSPDNPEVLNNLGLSQALAGNLDAGIATLRRADEQPASGAQVRQNLALLLALKGDTTAAERLTRRDLSPEVAAKNNEILRQLAKNRVKQ